MNDYEQREEVIRLLQAADKPLSGVDLARELGLHGKGKKRLGKWLHTLIRDGVIVRIRGNRYTLGQAADLFSGPLVVRRSGRGFVDSRDGRSAMIPEKSQRTALPGDLVVARQVKQSSEGGTLPEAEVIRIEERVRHDIVGTLATTGRFYHVVPLDPVYRRNLYVPDAAGARVGDRVVARFVDWTNPHVNPEAEIVEVLGPEDSPSIDTLSILRQYHLPETFPEEVSREAEVVSERMDRPGRRMDLRDRFIVTIDPERARDFDDALSLETDSVGRRVLGVHIADVSHFVRRGGSLDAEARKRGNSVYLPDKVIPMLPEQLSNGVCSLRPDEDRLAFSVFLTFSDKGKVEAQSFARSMIRSRKRLTYEQAFTALSPKHALAPELDEKTLVLLRGLSALAQQLRRRRFARFALALDVPECEIVTDDQGQMTGLRPVVNDESHQLVEECMVAANEAVARELHESEIPFISRFHAPPKVERIESLAAELAELGYHPGDLTKRRNLAAFLKSVEGDPLAHHVRIAVLKSMNQAVYSAKEHGHFGLAKAHYAHFTSPIRRYPDLIVHRQLDALLRRRQGGGRSPFLYPLDRLEPIAQGCSDTERQADLAERELTEIMKFRYLERQISSSSPETFEAAVVKVMNFGLFVELLDLQIQGMVHVSSLSDRFVRYNSQRQTLQDGKTVYGVGKRMTVRVVKVDFAKRRIDAVPEDSAYGKRRS